MYRWVQNLSYELLNPKQRWLRALIRIEGAGLVLAGVILLIEASTGGNAFLLFQVWVAFAVLTVGMHLLAIFHRRGRRAIDRWM